MFSFCSNPEYHTWHCVTVSQSFLVFYNLDSFEDFWPISPHPGLSNVFPFKARKELIFHLLGGGSIYTEHLESFCKKFSIASPFINVFDHLFISAWQTFTAIYLLGYNPIPFDFFHCSNCSSPEHRGLFPVTFLSFFFPPFVFWALPYFLVLEDVLGSPPIFFTTVLESAISPTFHSYLPQNYCPPSCYHS